ncbi:MULTISPECIES: LCP family protein [Nocardiopsidaceae]|uniref:LCP family protein n=1 Tax=Streptomonospora nanhaiensis TaxID=1323731 RepID=A0ABY6YM59_9ACTN|nr:LCP family protein [Streptomonospora nanhaiensis]WAE73454.1 LCP family protein [Streptomonospora nanhaiensis]
MPADENSSAGPGADKTPDETPEKTPGSDPGPGAEPSAAGRPGADGTEEAGDDGVNAPASADPAPGGPGGDERSGDEGVPGAAAAEAGAEAPEASEGPGGAGAPAAPDGDGAPDGDSAPDGGGAGGDGAETAPSPPPGPRGRRRGRRIAVWTAAVLAVLLVAGVASAYGYYHFLRSGMVRHDLDTALKEEERPDKISDAVNILFMGSDGYEEGSTAYSQEFEGERSDSIMLAHISPENRVSVISFPRDSLVELPQCDAYGNTEGTYGYFGMVNAAMYHGGPPCVVRTIESLTDIRIDHFVHLSFMSFRDVVDAIGGVDICIPEPMSDRRSRLDLDAGQQTLNGDQALSFVRARYEIGDGGDIGRIDRQQMFLAALADQVTSSDVMTSPTKLNGILQAVAQHSATDQELTLDRMLSIAVTMADADLSDIEFHTVPWYQAPFDANRVMWHEQESAELFAAVREDRPLPALLAADDAPAPQEPPGASPTPVDAASASDAPDAAESARPGGGRDATSNPCADGLGFGTGEEEE